MSILGQLVRAKKVRCSYYICNKANSKIPSIRGVLKPNRPVHGIISFWLRPQAPTIWGATGLVLVNPKNKNIWGVSYNKTLILVPHLSPSGSFVGLVRGIIT